MESVGLLDRAGRRRPQATLSAFHHGRVPRAAQQGASLSTGPATRGGDHRRIWVELRRTLPVGALFCVVRGPTRGRPCSPARIRAQLHRTALIAGVRRRFAPHQLRHAHAVEMSREGIPLLVIQRQLGHADLGITSAYLRGIDNTEIIRAVHERPAPMIPAGPTLPG
jgi:integrase